jgi:polysaccharide biosynthesis transport protein
MGKNEVEPTGGAPLWHFPGRGTVPGSWSPQPHEGGAPGSEINLAALLRIASEWRWLIFAAAVVGLSLAIIATLLTTPLYRATTVMEINPPSIEILENSKGAPVVSNDRDFLETQYGLLRSRSLAERVAQELNLGSNSAFAPEDADRQTRHRVATNKLIENFTVAPVQGSRLVRLSYSGEDAALSARIVNSFADNFINSNLERRYEASSYARQFLERQIARLKGELENTERRLVAYAQQQGLITTPSSGENGQSGAGVSLTGSSLAQLNEALAHSQTRRIAAQERYRQAQAAGNTAEVSDRVAPLRAARAQLEAEYREKLNLYKPDYPDMVRLKARIDAADQAIRTEAGSVTSSRVNTAAAEYRAAAAEEQQLQGRVNALKSAVMNERGRSIQYNILQRDLDTNRSLYDALLQRYREIGIAGGVGTNLISIVDRAQPPGGPYTPNLVLNLLIGLISGLALGFLLAFALDFLNDVIKTPDDMREKLGLPPLGSIPVKKGSGSFAEELSDRTSAVSEAYFSLTSALQFSTESGIPKTLLITSTRAAEGKSSTTLALVQNLARLGNRVLLIDSDLRKPAFVTGLEPKEGLSKLLTNSDAVSTHVLRTEMENLWLIPCGPLPPNPAELLASARLKGILAEATELFDIVVVDGPPVLGLADAPLLSSVCRATLLVVESGKTRTKAAVDAVGRLKGAGAHIIGGVLTKYQARAHGYGYGYGSNDEPYRYGGVGSREREITIIAHRGS